ncbi:hypothetical protein OJ997_27035 [Solirubrobacter phytolaccae]|uniref:DNA alkylation repair protein n=1 Tax=Solirubrobacter phytolaccae TaxID=1404360 RepID=A0A9X3SI81_9ACTN|nr:hypothetical protein [Solirubrobacter phytolaccae]MDA0183992.1 hypothetical protein [Solirubrobacter phytolaccae]
MDELIDPATVRRLGRLMEPHGVEARGVVAAAADAVSGHKLRRRVDIVRDALMADLPEGYDAAATAVRAAFEDETFTGWMLWPVSEAVVGRALQSGLAGDLDDAMDVLALLTTRLTGEFAIRAMLAARFERTLEIAQAWTSSENPHVRRLASEGTRSHLPWAKGVPELVRRPGATRPIVDALYADEAEYVRRSVANHVNDLSRDDPDLAADIVAGWLDRPDAHTPRVARHALRTLIKQGHPRALQLMGFDGTEFEARGASRPKVFKIASRSIAPGETVLISKSYSFRPQTTRTFHPGEHAIELQINGRPYGRDTFQLISAEESS